MKNKLILWVLGKTKIGGVIKRVQMFLDGKKTLIASLGTAIAGTLTILGNFANEETGGARYLSQVASTPEFLAASGGWIAVFASFKGEKIRNENAEIITKLNKNAADLKDIKELTQDTDGDGVLDA